MSNYSVGQILFLIANNKVIPVQVIEEVIRTTLDGKEKTYIVKFPDKDGTISDIKKLKSELFESPKAVRIFMIDNATKAIDDMLYVCEEMSINSFGHKYDSAQSSVEYKLENSTSIDHKELLDDKINQEVQQENFNDIITVDLGNGKFGKIKNNELEKAGSLE
jgi:hypothetical protein